MNMEIKSETLSGVSDYSRLYLDQKHSTLNKQKLKFGMEEILGNLGTDRVSKVSSETTGTTTSCSTAGRPGVLQPCSLSSLLSLSRPDCDILTASSPPPRPLFPPSFLLPGHLSGHLPGHHPPPLPQQPPPPHSLPLLGVSPPFLSAPAMSPWYQVRNYPGLGLLGGIPGLSFGGSKRKKSWTRAVFSNLQRKGLEKRFQIQKYITKPDRRQLAASLGLTDAQVKVWFQNRRMKWRHQESKERREGRVEGETVGWGGNTNIFEDEYKSEEDEEDEDDDVCPVVADSTVDKDGLI